MIRTATSQEDFTAFAELCQSYDAFYRSGEAAAPFADCADLVRGLELVEMRYGAPDGVTMVAEFAEKVAGGGAVRRLPDRTGKLEYLYVEPWARGVGLGKLLAAGLVEQARRLSCRCLRVEIGDRQIEALYMCATMGFAELETDTRAVPVGSRRRVVLQRTF